MNNFKAGRLSIIFNIAAGIIGLIILVIYLDSSKSLPSFNEYMKQNEKWVELLPVQSPKGTITAIVATSSIDMEKGLGGRLSLALDQGMLFVFLETGKKEFWMKDMFFPIDIIWLNEKKEVIGIVPNLGPETYPNSFISPASTRYVLELNAGYAEKYGIATGTPLTFVM